MVKLYRWIITQKTGIIFIILLVLLVIVPNLITNIILLVLPYELDWKIQELPYNNSLLNLIVILIKTPILETFIYQFLPYIFFRHIIKIKTSTIILFSSLIFGIVHYYNFIYTIYGIIAGAILMVAYIIFARKRYYPFIMVTIMHFIVNLIAYFTYI